MQAENRKSSHLSGKSLQIYANSLIALKGQPNDNVQNKVNRMALTVIGTSCAKAMPILTLNRNGLENSGLAMHHKSHTSHASHASHHSRHH